MADKLIAGTVARHAKALHAAHAAVRKSLRVIADGVAPPARDQSKQVSKP